MVLRNLLLRGAWLSYYTAARDLGLEPQLPEVPSIEGEPAIRGVRALDDRERLLDVVHVDVVGHELVGDRRVRVVGGVGAELPEALHDLPEPALGSHDVADLDVMRGKRRGGLEQQRPPLVGRPAALVVRVEEPVAEELQLEVA